MNVEKMLETVRDWIQENPFTTGFVGSFVLGLVLGGLLL